MIRIPCQLNSAGDEKVVAHRTNTDKDANKKKIFRSLGLGKIGNGSGQTKRGTEPLPRLCSMVN